jgi:hypothetical protein
MSLDARVKKLEALSREWAAQPCRWCRSSWSYPADFPPVDGVRPPQPVCERPGECPGGGLLIVIGDGDDEEVLFVAADRTRRSA